jgi:hypothetical protein
MALLTPLDVTRRIAALAGWRVYIHHLQADPDAREEPVSVRLDVPAARFVKFADRLS